MLTSANIKNKRFEKSGRAGYRADEVDAFLLQVAASIDAMESENAALQRKLEILAEKIEEYRKDEDNLRNALLGAQRLGDSVVKEARANAETMIKEATQKSEFMLRDATIKSETMISNAEESIKQQEARLARIKREVSSFKNQLISLYSAHIELINRLPQEMENAEKENITFKPAFTEEEEVVAAPAEEEAVADEPAVQEPEEEIVEEAPAPQPEEEEIAEEPVKPAQEAFRSLRYRDLKFGENYNLRDDG
ncbi:MAG: DivIVA domain-containing protein [Ruminococcaceae bacterium]|nr:DivIVA domain-containing protein [Oscillospiraceae bacterium]